MILVQCDGKQPACGRCFKNNMECQYDVSGGQSVTKMQSLRKELDTQRRRLDDLEAVVQTMQYSSDSHAAYVLAQLRLGESIEDIVATL